jgi:hypothetical protein
MSTSLPPRRLSRFALSLALIPVLYGLTLASTIVWGDPTEYTFVAHVLGIAHPPGYAFFTLAGKLFQTLVPFGDIPQRMHLVSAAAATVSAAAVYATVRLVAADVLAGRGGPAAAPILALLAGLFAAFALAFGADVWQHAIHANPHIVTAAFLVVNCFLLTRWAVRSSAPRTAGSANRWLFAFSLSAGLGVTHHPLTVFGFPAYALFILLVRPRIWREWRTLLGMVAFALLGLAVWLYFPIRSAMDPLFGPSTMNTLDGFLDHVLARGLSESLPFVGLADLPGRLLVFWTLLRLQYTLPVIILAVAGFAALLRRGEDGSPAPWKLAVLYGLAFLGVFAFVISLRAQDVMAYLLGPFMLIALLAGIGFFSLTRWAAARFTLSEPALAFLAAAIFAAGPVIGLARTLPVVSLRGYDAAARYADDVFARFGGRGEGAVLLNDWEHQTPLWYSQFVEERLPAEADVRPILVSTALPWLESVFTYLPGGPVYLSNYRREIVDAGFRLRPDGPFYRVVEPGDASLPAGLTPATAAAGDIEIAGYSLPQTDATPGAFVPLTLAMRARSGTDDYYVPVVRVGDLSFPFTTDSHLVTPAWEPGEVIVERFDFALPLDLPGGAYPVTVGLKNLSTDTETALRLPVGTLRVVPDPGARRPDDLLANYRQRVGLVSARLWDGLRPRRAPWSEPVAARPGETLNLALEWESLAPAEESYTVFVHLIDAANRPLVALDYTPLGGSTPTHLWLPKWLPGQRMLDPYRLSIPADLAPGTYYVEVGLYEMVSKRRLHMADEAGNLIGDRLILGAIEVR